jgi:glycosyltransferase involved in cell wall biosynthesis
VGRAAAAAYRWLTPGTIIGRPRACDVVHFYHGHVFRGYYGRLKSAVFVAIEKMLARFTGRIIVPSRQQMEEINNGYRIGRREQFRVVPYGLELEDFIGTPEHRRRLRSSLGIGDDEIVVGIVGRLTAIKNQEMFLRVAARVQEQHPNGPRFVIFGIGGDRPLLEERARAMNLRNVVFAGYVEDAREIYSSIDIIALTSRNEGMPLTLIEAMANGKAVASTAAGGVVDLLGSVKERGEYEIRERGLTAAVDDDAGLTAAILRLIDDDELRRSLEIRGRDHVLRTHGKDTYTEAVKSLYRDLRASSS